MMYKFTALTLEEQRDEVLKAKKKASLLFI